MHQGLARVALCFLTKLGVLYFYAASVLSVLSLYVLVAYFCNDAATSSGGNGNKPVAPPESDSVQKSGIHFKLASNLKHLQMSLSSHVGETMSYGLDLMSYIQEYSILPSCEQKVVLNIYITSAPRNFRQRSAIRQSWCSRNMTTRILVGGKNSSDLATRCVFLLGRSLSDRIQKAVQAEGRQHRDILQGVYLDSYRNLTIKVLQGFIWQVKFCPSAYVLKTDDDCFVNVPVLKLLLGKSPPSQRNLYVGHVIDKKQQRRVVRDEASKWQVSKAHYSPPYYPPYVSGSGYLLSSDLVNVIASVYQSRPLLPVEDAYIGLLLNDVGITPMHSHRFSVHWMKWHLCNLLYLVVIHQVSTESQLLLTSQCVHSYSVCTININPTFLWN